MGSVVYFKDSDGMVVGATIVPKEVNIDVELPHWGPGISALRVIALPPHDRLKKLKVVNGNLIQVVNQVVKDHDKKLKKDKKDGRDKLKALGLTDDEMDALLNK